MKVEGAVTAAAVHDTISLLKHNAIIQKQSVYVVRRTRRNACMDHSRMVLGSIKLAAADGANYAFRVPLTAITLVLRPTSTHVTPSGFVGGCSACHWRSRQQSKGWNGCRHAWTRCMASFFRRTRPVTSACEMQCDQDNSAVLQGERFAGFLDGDTGKLKQRSAGHCAK